MKCLYQTGTFYEDIAQKLKGSEIVELDNFDIQAQNVKTDSNKYFYVADAAVSKAHKKTDPDDLELIDVPINSDLMKNIIKPSEGILGIAFKKENIAKKGITQQALDNFLENNLSQQQRKELWSMAEETIDPDKSMLTIFRNNFPLYKKGIATTLKFGIYGTLGGFALSLLLVFFKVLNITKKNSHFVIYYLHQTGCKIIDIYIWVIKSTPMLVQAFVGYYVFKELFLKDVSWYTPMFSAYMVIILNTMGYIAEIITKNISFLDKGQIEASSSLGMSHTQTMYNIVLPQAIKTSEVPILNQFIMNLKDCVVFSTLRWYY
ncbi:ABC transporter permease subunit [Candidatus Phytoplasma australiense]|uniref:Inner membrane amino-acid ABC transporter permease protein yecS n=1 Tax=Strawberry lethal yellows phytoplasma (CPA) str. NZSb11 TaxID=980422 RepID=R4RZR4_PHYAS|nr:ABC transporter permease subunit [Candidatus Phytoplasma australiense]AGL89943.1 Inner membrane amino-acid ABC transporter permease protein yecS [Strawberry lethal yellows phytoplasma (CPA) str. NZSb11]